MIGDRTPIVLPPDLTPGGINNRMYSSGAASPFASPSRRPHPRGKVNQNVAEADSKILATGPSDAAEGAQATLDTAEGTQAVLDAVEGMDTVDVKETQAALDAVDTVEGTQAALDAVEGMDAVDVEETQAALDTAEGTGTVAGAETLETACVTPTYNFSAPPPPFLAINRQSL